MSIKDRLLEVLFKFIDVMINSISNIDLIDMLLVFLIYSISKGTAPELFLQNAYEWISVIIAYLIGKKSDKTIGPTISKE